MAYADTITYLLGLEASRGWDLKLERVRETLARLGNPEEKFAAVLIAGTNGKGSTAALVENALLAQGLAAGLYTSPHLVHFTERIRIGGCEISQAGVVDLVEEIRVLAPPEETGLTFFEITTVLALLALPGAVSMSEFWRSASVGGWMRPMSWSPQSRRLRASVWTIGSGWGTRKRRSLSRRQASSGPAAQPFLARGCHPRWRPYWSIGRPRWVPIWSDRLPRYENYS